MSSIKNTILYSFDGTDGIDSSVVRPDKYSSLLKDISNGPFIARGSGLSYALATASNNAVSVSTELFNRIIAFDATARTITAEPGLTIGELLDFSVKHQLYFPVLPGYPKITIGGCAGFNVHGKTQFSIGNFCDFVLSFKLLHPTLGELDCSRTQNEELFHLTLGGFGLTGYIAELTLQLIPLPGKAIKSTKIPVQNVVQAVNVMRQNKNDNTILYSWNNFNARGDSFGKGFVFSETFVDEDVAISNKPYGTISSGSRRGKNPLANQLSYRAVPVAYNIIESLKGQSKTLDIRTASFPIDGKEVYFKFFGNKGFREYQAIIPFEQFDTFSKKLELVVKKFGIPVTLGSLKLFSGKTTYLNFCADGVCITLDVPNYSKSPILFNEIDLLVIEHQGIANLSKDSRLNASTIKKMYPEYDLFKERINQFDKDQMIRSTLRDRIDV